MTSLAFHLTNLKSDIFILIYIFYIKKCNINKITSSSFAWVNKTIWSHYPVIQCNVNILHMCIIQKEEEEGEGELKYKNLLIFYIFIYFEI